MSTIDSIRRRYPALLMLAGGALIAALSFWALEMTRRSGSATQADNARSEPDYFVEQFNFAKISVNGDVQYTISGEKLVHHPIDDASTITLPVVKSYAKERAPLLLRADRALVNSDHSEIRFFEQVKMTKPNARGEDDLTVESDYMLALPDQDIVKSDKKVVIRLADSILIGTGFLADNRQHQLTLQSQVNGTYAAPKK